MTGHASTSRVRYLIDYPMPLDAGHIVYLTLPRDGIETSEADRIGRMLQALVVTPSCRRCWKHMSYDRAREKWRCHERHREPTDA